MNQSHDHSRREFLRQSTVLGAGAVLAGSGDAVAEQPSEYDGRRPFRTDGVGSPIGDWPMRRRSLTVALSAPKTWRSRSGIAASSL